MKDGSRKRVQLVGAELAGPTLAAQDAVEVGPLVAGRASRDGLREALVQMFNDESGFAIPLLQIASKALYEDDKEAGNGK